jgi:hypothetical protein
MRTSLTSIAVAAGLADTLLALPATTTATRSRGSSDHNLVETASADRSLLPPPH